MNEQSIQINLNPWADPPPAWQLPEVAVTIPNNAGIRPSGGNGSVKSVIPTVRIVLVGICCLLFAATAIVLTVIGVRTAKNSKLHATDSAEVLASKEQLPQFRTRIANLQMDMEKVKVIRAETLRTAPRKQSKTSDITDSFLDLLSVGDFDKAIVLTLTQPKIVSSETFQRGLRDALLAAPWPNRKLITIAKMAGNSDTVTVLSESLLRANILSDYAAFKEVASTGFLLGNVLENEFDKKTINALNAGLMLTENPESWAEFPESLREQWGSHIARSPALLQVEMSVRKLPQDQLIEAALQAAKGDDYEAATMAMRWIAEQKPIPKFKPTVVSVARQRLYMHDLIENISPAGYMLCMWADASDVNLLVQLTKSPGTSQLAPIAIGKLLTFSPPKALECMLANVNDSAWLAEASLALRDSPNGKGLVKAIIERTPMGAGYFHLLDATASQWDTSDRAWIESYSQKVPNEFTYLALRRSLNNIGSRIGSGGL